MAKCKKCASPTKGFKCDICGSESRVHVKTHKCGGKHCMPKCAPCGKAEVLCGC